MRLSILCICLAVQLCPASAQIFENMFTRRSLGIPPGITAPVVADFTNDGIPDLLVHRASEVSVYPGRGEGAFGDPVVSQLPQPESRASPHAAVAADFNQDGRLDLCAFGRIFLGNGDGSLTYLLNVPVQDRLQVIDLNKDGVPDLAGMTSPTSFGLLWGTPDARFSKFYGDAWFEIFSVRIGAVADLNADGRPDVLVDEGGGRVAAFLLGTNLQPAPPGNPFTRVASSLPWSGSTFALTDITGDQVPDLLTTGAYGPIALWKGRADGTFEGFITAAPVSQYFGAFNDFTVADINRDGKPDVAAIYYDEDDPRVLLTVSLGSGGGTFSYPIALGELNITSNPLPPLTVGDWNNDGLPDLATADSTSIVLFLQQGIGISSALGSNLVAPGSLASIYLDGLSEATAVAPSLAALPDTLAGVKLLVESNVVSPAELLYVSPKQINFRVPQNAQIGLARLYTETTGGSRYIGTLRIFAAAPAIFPNAVSVTQEPEGTALILTLYATGLNGFPKAAILLNGKLFPVEFAGPVPEILGLDFVRARIPRAELRCIDPACTQEIRLYVANYTSLPIQVSAAPK